MATPWSRDHNGNRPNYFGDLKLTPGYDQGLFHPLTAHLQHSHVGSVNHPLTN